MAAAVSPAPPRAVSIQTDAAGTRLVGARPSQKRPSTPPGIWPTRACPGTRTSALRPRRSPSSSTPPSRSRTSATGAEVRRRGLPTTDRCSYVLSRGSDDSVTLFCGPGIGVRGVAAGCGQDREGPLRRRRRLLSGHAVSRH